MYRYADIGEVPALADMVAIEIGGDRTPGALSFRNRKDNANSVLTTVTLVPAGDSGLYIGQGEVTYSRLPIGQTVVANNPDLTWVSHNTSTLTTVARFWKSGDWPAKGDDSWVAAFKAEQIDPYYGLSELWLPHEIISYSADKIVLQLKALGYTFCGVLNIEINKWDGK